MVIKDFNIAEIRLRVSKPGALRYSKDVGVIIERNKAHMNKFYVLIGSNIDPHNNINLCLEKIAAHSDLEQIQLSSFYESEAFGMEGDNFINAVIYLKSKKP